jgi:hypothetical protein
MERVNTAGDIGGGRFSVNARAVHALVRIAAESAIAKGNRFGECPRRQSALFGPAIAHLPKGSRFMAFTRLAVRYTLGALVVAAFLSAPLGVSFA